MSRFALVALIAGLCLIFWLISSRPALIRGVDGGMLVSPHRPDVAVKPAPTFNLIDARRANPAVEVEHQVTPSNADVWYALYATADVYTPPARLIVLFAQARPRYEWLYDAPRPKGADVLKHKLSQHDAMEGDIMLYTVTSDQDPWRADSEGISWSSGSLVCRWRFLFPMWRFVILVEYREQLQAGDLPPEANPAALAAFEVRAHKAFELLKASKEHPLPAPSQNLPYPPEGIAHVRLGTILGPVRASTRN